MRQDRDSRGGGASPEASAPPYIDGVVYDGIDPAAAHRAHVRALTTARQAAERRHARPAEPGADRAATFQSEMARIDAAHRAWLLEQGEGVLAPRRRTRRPSSGEAVGDGSRGGG